MKKRIKEDSIKNWLSSEKISSSVKKYEHLLLKTNGTPVPDDLKNYFNDAHKEAQDKFINEIIENNLDPLNDPPFYTSFLPLQTLQGYFGETIGALIVKIYKPFDKNWEIPCHLFKFHELAFDYLDLYLQTDGEEAKKAIVGRSGDDSLAFFRNESGDIVAILFIEAKCCLTHDSELINDGHKKLNLSNLKPVSRRHIKQLLKEKGDPESLEFLQALDHFNSPIRFNMVSYACGKSPQRPVNRKSWMDPNTPNQNYTSSNHLIASEIHILDLENLILEIYEKEKPDASTL